MKTLKILLVGATGQMGKVVSDSVKAQPDMVVVAGISIDDSTKEEYPIYKSFSSVTEECDIIVDYSSPVNTKSLLEFAVEKKIPLVIATTGQDENEIEMIHEASKKIPILKSGNMSLGINLMLDLVRRAAKGLENYDIEIVEYHHNKKKDAPSGTARMLGDSIDQGRDQVMNRIYGREGRENERTPEEIGFHSVRGGSIVGVHEVIFAGEDEIVELRHVASSKKIFANGTLKAVRFLIDKEPALYSMKDLY